MFTSELFARENEEFIVFAKNATAEGDSVDPLIICYDNMKRIAQKIRFLDKEKLEKKQLSERAIRVIKATIEKKYTELDRSEDNLRELPREKLEKMLKQETENLKKAEKNLKNTPKEIKDALIKVIKGSADRYDPPAICPENGEYFATQVELFNYVIKCSKHGVDREVFSKIYEREMKKVDPIKFCRRNILDITNACEDYNMENGYPKQWSMTLILQTGYLKNKRTCPSGGNYIIKSTPGESNDVKCSCSVHSGAQK